MLVFTRLLLIGTLCGLVCRVVRFFTGSFGLNGSRECNVRNKQWLRLSLLRRQSDHTEGEVPVDRCQLQFGVHTTPSHWYSLWPGLSCCSIFHWELRIEWQQGMYVRNKQWLRLSLLPRQSDHTEGDLEVPVDCCQLQVGVHTAPSQWYSLWPGLSCCSVLHWELRIEWQQGMSVR